MSKFFLHVDISSIKNKTDDNIIKFQFQKDDLEVNFNNFFVQSRYLRIKYKYFEALDSIQSEIEEIMKTHNVSEESIKCFLRLIQDEKINIPIERYKDIYALSEYFGIDKIKSALDNVNQKELFTNLKFTIQVLYDSEAENNGLDTKLIREIENFLKGHIDECFEDENFKELQISTICRILSQSRGYFNHNLLFDFIVESPENRFILFKYVEVYKMTDKKVDEFIKFINEQEEDSKKIYLEHLPFDFTFIKNIKYKYNQIYEELNQTNQELNQTNQELNQTNQELNQTKQELNQTKHELNLTNQELNNTKLEFIQTKQELNQIKIKEEERLRNKIEEERQKKRLEFLKKKREEENQKENPINNDKCFVDNQIYPENFNLLEEQIPNLGPIKLGKYLEKRLDSEHEFRKLIYSVERNSSELLYLYQNTTDQDNIKNQIHTLLNTFKNIINELIQDYQVNKKFEIIQNFYSNNSIQELQSSLIKEFYPLVENIPKEFPEFKNLSKRSLFQDFDPEKNKGYIDFDKFKLIEPPEKYDEYITDENKLEEYDKFVSVSNLIISLRNLRNFETNHQKTHEDCSKQEILLSKDFINKQKQRIEDEILKRREKEEEERRLREEKEQKCQEKDEIENEKQQLKEYEVDIEREKENIIEQRKEIKQEMLRLKKEKKQLKTDRESLNEDIENFNFEKDNFEKEKEKEKKKKEEMEKKEKEEVEKYLSNFNLIDDKFPGLGPIKFGKYLEKRLDSEHEFRKLIDSVEKNSSELLYLYQDTTDQDNIKSQIHTLLNTFKNIINELIQDYQVNKKFEIIQNFYSNNSIQELQSSLIKEFYPLVENIPKKFPEFENLSKRSLFQDFDPEKNKGYIDFDKFKLIEPPEKYDEYITDENKLEEYDKFVSISNLIISLRNLRNFETKHQKTHNDCSIQEKLLTKKQINELKPEEIKSVINMIDPNTKEINELKQQNKQLQIIHNDFMNQIENLKKQINQLNQEKKKEENNQKSRITDSQIEQFNIQNENLKNQIEVIYEENQDLKNQILQLSQKKQKEEINQSKEINIQLKEINNEKENLMKQIESFNQNKVYFDRQIQQYNQKNEDMQKFENKLKADANILNNEKKALQYQKNQFQIYANNEMLRIHNLQEQLTIERNELEKRKIEFENQKKGLSAFRLKRK